MWRRHQRQKQKDCGTKRILREKEIKKKFLKKIITWAWPWAWFPVEKQMRFIIWKTRNADAVKISNNTIEIFRLTFNNFFENRKPSLLTVIFDKYMFCTFRYYSNIKIYLFIYYYGYTSSSITWIDNTLCTTDNKLTTSRK